MTGEVVYARILDGETLWLAVRGAGALTVHGPAGSAPVAAERLDDADGPLLSVRLDVASLLATAAGQAHLTFDLDGTPLAWANAQAPGPTKVPPTRAGRWQLRLVAPDGELRVARAGVDPAVVVDRIAGSGEVVELQLGVTGDAELVTLHDDRVLAAMPIGPDGIARLTATSGLLPGRLAVRRAGAVLPVVRRQRDLKRPNFAVALPSLAGGQLQWLPDGQLVLAEEPA